MKNKRKILSLIIVAVMSFAMFAVSVWAAVGDVVYSDTGAHALTGEEALDEFFAGNVVRYWPIGDTDVLESTGYGAMAQSISQTDGGVASVISLDGTAIGSKPSDIYLGKTSSSAYKLDYGNFSKSSGYLSFSFGSAGDYTSSGIVFEFDLFVGLNSSGKANIPASYVNSSGKTVTGSINIGMLTAGGASAGPHSHQAIKITAGAAGYWKLGSYSFRADQWQHVTIQYIPSSAESVAAGTYDGVYNVYVGDDTTGRKLARSFSAKGSSNPNNGVTIVGEIEPNFWRLTYTGEAAQENCAYLDNMLVYKGTKIHDPFVRNKQTEGYTLIMDSVLDDTLASRYRLRAYEYAESNMAGIESVVSSSAQDSELRAAYRRYKNFVSIDSNVESLTNSATVENTAHYLELAEAAAALNVDGSTRSLSNVAQRTEAYNVAKTFLNNVGTAITPDSDNYLAAEALLKDVIADCEVDAFALRFIKHMDMFSKNSSGGFVVPMERSYNEAKKLYPKLPAVSVYASTDSNTAEYSSALSTYATANSVLIETSRTSNTERFINIVDILTSASDLSSDEKYRRIWKVAYDIIYTEAYDSTVSGFSAALTGFNNGPHAYFWQILQSEHLQTLEECASIIESDNAEYIEKAWASTFVIRYFEEQLPYIDSSNSRAFAIKTIAEECYAGLDQLKEEHDLLLETNYDLFKTAVEEMMVAEGYTQIKEKYLVAREYYYTMMIPDGAALEYVEFYESTEDWLNVVEADCTIFVEVASVIGGIDDRELLYRELVRGYACLGSLDNGFEGVEEATATFYSVYNAYESESESINAAVSVAQDVVCSVRANSPIASIIEFLRSLFD